MSTALNSKLVSAVKSQNQYLRKLLGQITTALKNNEEILEDIKNDGVLLSSKSKYATEYSLDEMIFNKTEWENMLKRGIKNGLIKYNERTNQHYWIGFGSDKVASLAHFFMQLRLMKIVHGPFLKTTLGRAVFAFFNVDKNIKGWQDHYEISVRDTPLVPQKYKDLFDAVIWNK